MTSTVVDQTTDETPERPSIEHPTWCVRAEWTGGAPAEWTDAREDDDTHRGHLYHADAIDLDAVAISVQVIQNFDNGLPGRGLEIHALGVEITLFEREGTGRATAVLSIAEVHRLLWILQRQVQDTETDGWDQAQRALQQR
jgi:hypothetical protein